jgi:hypothetical protein
MLGGEEVMDSKLEKIWNEAICLLLISMGLSKAMNKESR